MMDALRTGIYVLVTMLNFFDKVHISMIMKLYRSNSMQVNVLLSDPVEME